jgi:hypothetical protein
MASVGALYDPRGHLFHFDWFELSPCCRHGLNEPQEQKGNKPLEVVAAVAGDAIGTGQQKAPDGAGAFRLFQKREAVSQLLQMTFGVGTGVPACFQFFNSLLLSLRFGFQLQQNLAWFVLLWGVDRMSHEPLRK